MGNSLSHDDCIQADAEFARYQAEQAAAEARLQREQEAAMATDDDLPEWPSKAERDAWEREQQDADRAEVDRMQARRAIAIPS